MAYAALLSLTQTLEQKLNRNPLPQTEHYLETILQQASFLREFLELSSQKRSKTRECLECEIRDAAYKVEDLIESHVVDSSHENDSLTSFFQSLEKVIEGINSIKERAMKIDEDEGSIVDLDVQDLQQRTISNRASNDKSITVGLDDKLKELKNQLLAGSDRLRIISVVGMGGIGKTTLVEQVYNDLDIIHQFTIRAWVTASQNYSRYQVLRDLLDSVRMLHTDTRVLGFHSESLDASLYKNLKGQKYLVVIDNMLDTNEWSHIQRIFPDDKIGSRVILTTRQDSASAYADYFRIQMDFLNKADSWTLFCENLGGIDCCTIELEEIGKKIVQQCGGLPHALMVIGRYLSNVPKTLDVWTDVAKNVSSVITSNDKENSKAFFLSYKILPHHLKGCFLYLGIFPEYFDIPVSTIIKLWIAEGFIKQDTSKSLEEVAEGYLLDLIKRSLILVSKRSSRGKVKTCRIHDLLRDICVNEAKKQMVFHVTDKRLDGIPKGTCVRRLSLSSRTSISEERPTTPMSEEKPSTCVPRSILDFSGYLVQAANFLRFELLKVLLTDHEYYLEFPTEITEFVNLRYLAARSERGWSLASIYKLLNLETIIVRPKSGTYPVVFCLPPEIWKISQLRHVQLHGAINLPDPPVEETKGGKSITVLENLQSLCIVKNFRCTMEVLTRIPNLLKLGIFYEYEPKDWEYFCLHNLASLYRLETVKCLFSTPHPSFLQNVTFPDSLTKITLSGCWLPWEDMSILGRLPNLAVLKLKHYAFSGPEWEPNVGEFEQLKFLLIEESDLEHWWAEYGHFPSLQHLIIKDCCCLEKIPECFAELATLQSIEVRDCYDSLESSAKKILEEQQEFGNDDFRLQIITDERSNSNE